MAKKSFFDRLINLLMDLKFIDRKFDSGTAQYPFAIDVFKAVMEYLISANDELEMAEFKCKTSKGWAEIRWLRDNFLVITFKFPFKDLPEVVFKDMNIIIPEYVKIRRFKRKRNITFQVSRKQALLLPPFLELVFSKFYNCPAGYIIKGRVMGTLATS